MKKTSTKKIARTTNHEPRTTSHEPRTTAFTTRLTDSVELGLKTGNGIIVVERVDDGRDRRDPSAFVFSEKNACPDCGISFDELKPRNFSFNSPFGACPTGGGLGSIYYSDEDLVIPDKTLSIYDGAIACWRGEKMGWFKADLIRKAER